jgi:crotonobetainyl-CoA:carnitine CoA-transferase CaiB-like acyl-CoA transferase
VPAALVWSPTVQHANPQMLARGFFEPASHPVLGELLYPLWPFRCAGVPAWIRSPAPRLGEHNREILREIGLDDVAISRLEDERVIGTRPIGA